MMFAPYGYCGKSVKTFAEDVFGAIHSPLPGFAV
jgi:hypothetical protein